MEYLADPSTADLALRSEEVEALASNEGRALRTDPRKMSHFLARCRATLTRHQDEVRQLKGELERSRYQQSTSVGQPTTLSPMDAVRYLSPQQLQQLFGVVARQQMEWLQEQRHAAQRERQQATAVLNEIRYLKVQLAENASMPAAVVAARLDEIIAKATGSSHEQS